MLVQGTGLAPVRPTVPRVPGSDVVVAGLGVAGASTALALARRGASVVALDANDPPHELGSSHGLTRITRLAVGEGDAYVPLVARSHELWRELEAQGHGELLVRSGFLVLGSPGGSHHGRSDFVESTVAIARRHGIDHELLGPDEVASRFPAIVAPRDVTYYEAQSGYLRAEACVRALRTAARDAGAAIRTGESVLGWERDAGRLRVATTAGELACERLVLCVGPWLGGLVPSMSRLVRVHRQVAHWLEVDEARSDDLAALPTYIWVHGTQPSDVFYGFPLLGGAACGLKVATEAYGEATDPASVDRHVGAGEAAALHAGHVEGRIRGARPRAVRSSVCLYTVTPDFGFVLDELPGEPGVVVVSACSGHGFKHAPALGECAAALALAEAPPIDCSAFALSRFG